MPQPGSAASRRPRRDDGPSLPLFPLTLEEESQITVLDHRREARARASRRRGDSGFGERPRIERVADDRGRDAVADRARDATDDWSGFDPVAELAALDRRVEANGGVPGRRTVEITGHTEDVYVPRRSRDAEWAGSHAPSRAQSRFESRCFQPDRAAMWAIFLGLLLILVAAASAHAAVLTLH